MQIHELFQIQNPIQSKDTFESKSKLIEKRITKAKFKSLIQIQIKSDLDLARIDPYPHISTENHLDAWIDQCNAMQWLDFLCCVAEDCY